MPTRKKASETYTNQWFGPLGPGDLGYTPGSPDFTGLVSGELGDQGTPADGFDNIVGGILDLLPTLDQASQDAGTIYNLISDAFQALSDWPTDWADEIDVGISLVDGGLGDLLSVFGAFTGVGPAPLPFNLPSLGGLPSVPLPSDPSLTLPGSGTGDGGYGGIEGLPLPVGTTTIIVTACFEQGTCAGIFAPTPVAASLGLSGGTPALLGATAGLAFVATIEFAAFVLGGIFFGPSYQDALNQLNAFCQKDPLACLVMQLNNQISSLEASLLTIPQGERQTVLDNLARYQQQLAQIQSLTYVNAAGGK